MPSFIIEVRPCECLKGYFRALSAWREDALGAARHRRAFAARSLLRAPRHMEGAGGTPGPPPQNLFQETNT